MHTPLQLIVAAFSDEDEAGRLLADLKRGRLVGLIGIIDAAAVVKDADGKLKITNAKHRSRRGLLTGGAIGGVVGLLSGPIGWGAVAGGGAIGALAGRLRNAPMKAQLEDLAESLTPGSSAIIAVVEHTWVERVSDVLAQEAARVVRDEIHADIADQLAAGGNVLYTASSDGAAARIVSAGDGGTDIGYLATNDGILVMDAQLTDDALPPLQGSDTTAN